MQVDLALFVKKGHSTFTSGNSTEEFLRLSLSLSLFVFGVFGLPIVLELKYSRATCHVARFVGQRTDNEWEHLQGHPYDSVDHG